MKRVLHLLQYIGLRILWLPLQLLPKKRLYGFGCAIGWCWFYIGKHRRGIAINNLLATRVAAGKPAARRIARRAAMHFTGHLLEAARLPRRPWQELADATDMHPDSLALFTTPGPVLLVSPHLGAWEAATHILPALKPMTVMARAMNNPFIQNFITGDTLRGRVEIIPKKRGFSPDVLRRWRDEGRIMTLLSDQHGGNNGLWADFLGVPASTVTSPARLHLRTGHPLVVGAFVRLGFGRFAMVADAPVRFTPTGDPVADTRAVTLEINRRMESLIRRYPGQYLWSHRRWRTPPANPKGGTA